MPDHGHDLAFGTFLTPDAGQPARVVALAQLTEQLGLELVTVQDHPYQSRHLDMWTLLSVVAARTTDLRVAPNVANLPLRPPLVLARAAATLDLLSNGRVELGLGAGAFWDAIEAAGGRRLTPAQAVRGLQEAIAICRASWDTATRAIRVDGEVHRVVGAHSGPAPAHPIGIWVGALGPRMLALTGRLANGWLPSSGYLPPDRLTESNARIDAAAVAAGREPRDVRRLYNVAGSFDGSGGFLQGPPSVWVEQLTTLALTEGISTFILASDDPDQIRRFAGDVVPAVREAVEAERDTPTVTGPVTEPLTGPSVASVAEPGAGQHLVAIHDHLRAELAQVRELVEQVAAGQLSVAVARSTLNEMTMRQNNWTLGTYCATYCRLVATHHTIEDATVFPHLRRLEPDLAPVLDRLSAEHHTIHAVLESVDRALVALVEGGSLDEVRSAVDRLADALLSHLSYEEDHLVQPLTRHGFN